MFIESMLGWKGLNVSKKVSFKNVNVLLSEREIIVTAYQIKNYNNFMDFYNSFFFFLKKITKNEIESLFGLFLDPNFNFIRQKCKLTFLDNLEKNNILSVLEYDNQEAYYISNPSNLEFIGLEIRYASDIKLDFNEENFLKEVLKKK